MTAYAISEVRPLDPDRFEEYRTLAADSIRRHGGRYLVRGGHVNPAEGTWYEGTSMIIVAFATMDALEHWYGSPDYAEALAIRRAGAMERRLLFVEGCDDIAW